MVKPGETLSNIAKKYHLQLDYLAALNGLTRNSTVRIGQRLKIDGDLPKLDAKVDEPIAKAVKSSNNTDGYTVKSGKSLNAIASRTGVSVAELAAMNGL